MNIPLAVSGALIFITPAMIVMPETDDGSDSAFLEWSMRQGFDRHMLLRAFMASGIALFTIGVALP